MHGNGHIAVLAHRRRIAPFRDIPVNIANRIFPAGIEGEKAEVLLVGLVIRPVRGACQIHGVHGIPCSFEPFILPGKDAASGAADRLDILVASDQGLSLLLLGHISLVSSGIHIAVCHASAGGNTEFRNHNGHGVVRGQQAQVGFVCIQVSQFIHKGGLIRNAQGCPVIRPVQIVGIIGVNVIRGKLS